MLSAVTERLRKFADIFSRWCSIAGGVTLLAMMLLIVAEVTLRSLAKMPIPGTIEIVQVMLIIVLFSGMAALGSV